MCKGPHARPGDKSQGTCRGCQREGAWQADPAATSPQQSLGAPNPRPHTAVCASGQTISPGPESPPGAPGRGKAVSARQRPRRRAGRRMGGHWEPCHSRGVQHGLGDGGQQPRPLTNPSRRVAPCEDRGGLCAPLHAAVCTSRHVGRPFEGRACWPHPRVPGTGVHAHTGLGGRLAGR